MTVATGVAISQLPAATLPLTGSEELALVQGGITKRAPSSAVSGAGEAIEVALVAGANNNVLADGIDAASRVAFLPAGDCTVSGVQGGVDGMRRMFVNRSASFTIVMLAETTSAAANRLASNGDFILPPLCGAEYVYDGENERWVKT